MKCIVCVAFEGFFLLLEKNPTGFGMRAFSITMKCSLFFISSFHSSSYRPFRMNRGLPQFHVSASKEKSITNRLVKRRGQVCVQVTSFLYEF